MEILISRKSAVAMLRATFRGFWISIGISRCSLSGPLFTCAQHQNSASLVVIRSAVFQRRFSPETSLLLNGVPEKIENLKHRCPTLFQAWNVRRDF